MLERIGRTYRMDVLLSVVLVAAIALLVPTAWQLAGQLVILGCALAWWQAYRRIGLRKFVLPVAVIYASGNGVALLTILAHTMPDLQEQLVAFGLSLWLIEMTVRWTSLRIRSLSGARPHGG
jgi:hypothetical protein